MHISTETTATVRAIDHATVDKRDVIATYMCHCYDVGMAQVTIYLPEKLAAASKRQAKRVNKSVSAWIAELIERETGTRQWPKALVEVLSHGRGSLQEPDDPPAEDIESVR